MTEVDGSLAALAPVQRVYRLGYRIRYRFRPESRHLDLAVDLAGRPVGHACVRYDESRRVQRTETIHVRAGHRRRGIANATMVCSLRLTGCRPEPATSQTDEGRAWWAQPNRPW